jgi:carboxylesterase type B
MDEQSCLNLTISAPRDALGEERKALPVMVYVHGVGFTEGSGHISALHGKLSFGWE